MSTFTRARSAPVDALRGLVMVIMALDHVRDFVHVGAMSFSPEDLSRTTPALFFTRWVTHVCAPTFLLLAGVGIALRLGRNGSPARLSSYLLTRGLWLIVLELVAMRLIIFFRLSPADPVLLLVLWVLGVSMVLMAGLVHLPRRALFWGSVLMIGFHNTLDGVRATDLGAWAPAWTLLHQVGAIVLGPVVVVPAYSIVPWVAVMTLGFALGGWLGAMDTRERARWIARGAWTASTLFVVLRAINLYGDPAPWATQSSAAMAVVSFFRVTKYPPSLSFLLMTLGLAGLVWSWFERHPPRPSNPLVVLGRVPLFYFLAHFTAAHLAAVALAYAKYGWAASSFAWLPLPSLGGSADAFPAGFGYPLWVVYATWLAVVMAVYPLCRWFAGVKAHRPGGWLSYL